MRRAIPISLIAAALWAGLWASPAGAGAVTRAQCESDYRELLAEIEVNRVSAIVEIKRQLAEADDTQRQSLLAMREQTWDDEERQRATASLIRQDCLKAAK